MISCTPAIAGTGFSGNVELQSQWFGSNDNPPLQQVHNLSLAASADYYLDIPDTNHRFVFAPFIRIDQRDNERSHADIRELLFSTYGESWEFRAGLGQVFWGVVESQNVVNIINQLDLVESPITTARLGQPMVHMSAIRDWGTTELFVLPGFRERTFVGENGRPIFKLPVDSSLAQYESSRENAHIDVALRYSHSVNEWDIGLSAFSGTAREPLLRLSDDEQFLVPFYYQVQQYGVDVQGTFESWIIKAEAVHRQGRQIRDHAKLVAGFEYSFYGVMDSAADIGVIGEYAYDGLGEQEAEVFQNEIIAGMRLVLNDEQSTEALVAYAVDIDDSSQFLTIEASRRVGNNIKMNLEAVTYESGDYIGASAAWFF